MSNGPTQHTALEMAGRAAAAHPEHGGEHWQHERAVQQDLLGPGRLRNLCSPLGGPDCQFIAFA